MVVASQGKEMHHTLAFFNTTAGTLANSDSPAVFDGWATIQNNHFIMNEDMYLLMAAPYADTVTDCQLNLPHWRFVSQPQIAPVIQTWDGPEAINPYMLEPKSLKIWQIDELQALVTTSGTATNGVLTALWLAPSAFTLNIPAGDVYPTRFTAQISGITGRWAQGNITFTQSLPAGIYSCIGMDVIDSGAQLARLRFQDYEMLPGTWVRNGATGTNPRQFRNGRLGEWGKFKQTAQPSLEIFSADGSSTAQTGIMDLVKVG